MTQLGRIIGVFFICHTIDAQEIVGSNSSVSLLNVTARRFLQSPARLPGQRISEFESAARSLRDDVSKLYGGESESSFMDGVKWYDSNSKDTMLVKRLLRALVKQDKFVVVVGGMSDTAGHGNKASEAYPMVMKKALTPVFAAAGVELVVRNLAMGGVPSFPNSLCMADAFGDDADLVVWDFRMVEHDDLKGELYLRQALMMPRAPAIMFKRPLRYLPALAAPYAALSSMHVIDEMPLYDKLSRNKNPGIVGDGFCETKCTCPGQVRWHSGWKTHRLRGLQMALVYAQMLGKAVAQYKDLLRGGMVDANLVSAHSRFAVPGLGLPPAPLPKPRHKSLQGGVFAETPFNCGLSWSPRTGRSLEGLIDTSSEAKGGTKWKSRDPNARISSSGKRCGYSDDKTELEGSVADGWAFFTLKDVKAAQSTYTSLGAGSDASGKGVVGFCADFPKPKESRLKDFEVLVLLNGEEVQSDMKFWMDAHTLGVSIQCYGTSKMVKTDGDENIIGFRVMQNGLTFKLTHLIWT